MFTQIKFEATYTLDSNLSHNKTIQQLESIVQYYQNIDTRPLILVIEDREDLNTLINLFPDINFHKTKVLIDRNKFLL